MLRMVKLIWFSVLSGALCLAHAAQPVLSNVVITDVSDRAFSIFLTADQIGQPSLEVFSDINGTNLIPDLMVSSYDVHTGNPALVDINRQQSKESIAQELKSKGIVKILVTGLSPDTDYYIRIGMKSFASMETTLCPDAGVEFCLNILNLVPVKTAIKSSREDSTTELFVNDVLLYLNPQANTGEVLIMASENSMYPVSAIVGDGVPAPFVFVDLNNVYGSSSEESHRLTGFSQKIFGNVGEAIIVQSYRGNQGNMTGVGMLGLNHGTGSLMSAMEVSYGDCNGDKIINGYDGLLLANVIAGVLGVDEYQVAGFHPAICNLYKEDGLNSLKTNVLIDQADASLLLDLLIGKIGLESLPDGYDE